MEKLKNKKLLLDSLYREYIKIEYSPKVTFVEHIPYLTLLFSLLIIQSTVVKDENIIFINIILLIIFISVVVIFIKEFQGKKEALKIKKLDEINKRIDLLECKLEKEQLVECKICAKGCYTWSCK